MDIVRDSNLSRLYSILRDNPEAAAFVKTADVLDSSEWASYPDEAFADPRNREFPLIDPQHTVISALYASKFGADVSVKENINRALDIYGVKDHAITRTPKVAESVAPVGYLLTSTKKYPIYTEATVKTAAAYFEDYAHTMESASRAEYGDALVKYASDFGVELSAECRRLAGHTVTNVKVARDVLFARAYSADNQQVAEAYTKIAVALDAAPEELADRAEQRKLVSLIADVDKLAGVSGRYSRLRPSPETAVFNTTKVAAPVINMGPYRVSESQLASIDPDILSDIIGGDMVNAMHKSGSYDFHEATQLLETLPRDMQDTVARTFRLRS